MNKYQRARHKEILRTQKMFSESLGINVPYSKTKRIYHAIEMSGRAMINAKVHNVTGYFDLGPIIITGFEITPSDYPMLPFNVSINWISKYGGNKIG